MSYDTEDEEKALPAQPRKGEGPMDQDELQSIMSGLVTDAEAFVDGELSPDRATATSYYKGEPFGNEEEGRSQVVMTEVRDNIHGIRPSLMRVFFGADRAVELLPRTKAGIATAKQATDYVQFCFVEDNSGFLRTYDVITDGLVRKLGIFKYWWEEGTRRAYREEDIDEETLNTLVGRSDVTPTKIEESEGEDGQKQYTVDYTVKKEGRVRIASVPGEEILFNRDARDLEEALFVAHRTNKTRGELIAMGYSPEEIDEHKGRSEKLASSAEAVERSPGGSPGDDVDAGEANEDIEYVEAYPYLDMNGDGEAELCKVCMIGPGHFVAHAEPCDERPFAFFCPIPEPHTIVGQSEADLTMDLQLVKSSLVRSMLDSLALSIFPRMGFIEGAVSVEDLLNTEIGAPIRMRRENAVQPITHPFTGEAAMPILQYFDEVGESRTGRAKGAVGLDSDSLQSSTPDAVGAAVQATQEHIELIARIFAEQTLKPLFRGVYKLLVKHRPSERLIKLRGEYVEINTAAWDAEMDVTVNVALGKSNADKKIASLMGIAAKQEQILQMLGPDNPLCTVQQLRETYAQLTELSGHKDVSTFWKEIPADWMPETPQPQKSPEQTLAEAQLQIEQMRTQKDLEIKQAELTLKQDDQRFKQELEIRRMAQDFTLRRYEIDAKYDAAFTQRQLEIDAQHEEAALTGAMDIHRMGHEQQMAERAHSLEEQRQNHEQSLSEASQSHEQEMAERQTAAAEAAASQAGTGSAE